MDTARKKILKARTGLLLDHPFFGSLCLRMEPQVDTRCATAWTDGRTLAYNPNYVRSLTDAQIMGLMAHTVMHPACQHHTRRSGRDTKLWNMACDHAINWILLDAGISLPPMYLDNPTYHGLTADEIYSKLHKQHNEENKFAFSDQQGESDGEADLDGLSGTGGDGDDLGEEGQSGAESDGEGLLGEGGEESESAEASTDGTGDPGGSGEVRDAGHDEQGGSSEENGHDDEWDLALAQAAQNARDMGDLPGALERLVQEVLSPKIHWQELLERFISDRARDDYSWTPPNKRFLHLNIILPSLSHQKLPDVVLALDTSGSVSEPEMNQFAAEVSGILEAFDTTIHVVYCDSKITGHESFGRQDLPLMITPIGGGGTDYRPVFQWVETMNLNMACLIYLTDMECIHFPEQEPDYPVLWAQIGSDDGMPPFGEVLSIR